MRQAGRYMAEYRAIRSKYTLLEICARPEVTAEVTLQPVRRLGVGQKQLVEILRAVDKRSRILVLDEPTAGVDVGLRRSGPELAAWKKRDPVARLAAALEAILTAQLARADQRLAYKGRLALFQPLVYSQTDLLERYDELVGAADPHHRPIADDWRTINVDVDQLFVGRITSALAVELAARLVYIKFDTAASLDALTQLSLGSLKRLLCLRRKFAALSSRLQCLTLCLIRGCNVFHLLSASLHSATSSTRLTQAKQATGALNAEPAFTKNFTGLLAPGEGPLPVGGGNHPVAVRGQVLFEGQPVPNATVTFSPLDLSKRPGMGITDAILMYLPLFHMFGFTEGLLMSVITGARQVLTSTFDARESLAVRFSTFTQNAAASGAGSATKASVSSQVATSIAPATAGTTGLRVIARTTMNTADSASGPSTDGRISFVIVKITRNASAGSSVSRRPRTPPIARSSEPAVGSPGRCASAWNRRSRAPS